MMKKPKKHMDNFFIYNITIYPDSVKITMTCDKLINISTIEFNTLFDCQHNNPIEK